LPPEGLLLTYGSLLHDPLIGTFLRKEVVKAITDMAVESLIKDETG